MNRTALQWYHRLPSAGRHAVATLRGAQLRRLRYGPETDHLVADALAREQWTDGQWRRWREARLSLILDRARHRVPYYRRAWEQREAAGGSRSFHQLCDWPILDKSAVRARPRQFVATDAVPRRMVHEQTSGTSGTPIELWWSRETVRQWYALFEARWRLWYGVSRNDRWGILGGQLVIPFAQRRPPFWVWNAALNQLYLSSYHLAPELVPSFLSALTAFRVEYLYGYTSALYALAQEAVRLKRRVPLRVVITNAEPLEPYQREMIREAFGCPVRETYGMSELVAAAGECAEGRLHLWPEVGILEIVPDLDDASSPNSGQFVCTGLLNTDMPLIRYAVGDRGSWPAIDTPCPCGRTLPILARIDGRQDDVLFSADGRRIGRLDPAFKAALPILEAQIIQESLRQVRIRYVPAAGFGPPAARELTRALQERLGPVNVVLEAISEVPRTANGKFRAVICAIPPEERAMAGIA